MAGRDVVAPRARELGAELRHARKAAGLTAFELARKLGCSESKVSRMETGQRGASELDVIASLSLCGLQRADILRVLELVRETDDGYRLRPHHEQLPDELRSLIVHEATATATTVYEPLLVPGLLQTRDYATAVFRLCGLFDEEGIQLRVRARGNRQRMVRQSRSPQFTYFVHERALRSVIGSARIMHQQLVRLVRSSDPSRSIVRVITDAALPAGITGPFWLMRYGEHKPVVYLENLTTSVFLEDPADVVHYRNLLSRLADAALDAEQSRQWLAMVASEYEYVEDPS